MRIAIAALALALTHPVGAAEIVGPYPMGCADPGWYVRAYRMARAGDQVALERFISEALRDGSCTQWAPGMQVRIEETRSPLVCVAPMGSTAPCRWLESREVKP